MILEILVIAGGVCAVLAMLAALADYTELGSGIEDLIRGDLPTDDDTEGN